MRWIDIITDSMHMNLSKFRKIVEDRGAWQAVVLGVKILDGQRGQQGRLGSGIGGVDGQPRSMYPLKRKHLLLSHSLWLPFGNVL